MTGFAGPSISSIFAAKPADRRIRDADDARKIDQPLWRFHETCS